MAIETGIERKIMRAENADFALQELKKEDEIQKYVDLYSNSKLNRDQEMTEEEKYRIGNLKKYQNLDVEQILEIQRRSRERKLRK